MIDLTKVKQTRDGSRVDGLEITDHAVFPISGNYHSDNQTVRLRWYSDGRFYTQSEGPYDLIEGQL